MNLLLRLGVALVAITALATQASAGTFVTINSQQGDYIGAGATTTYVAVTATTSTDRTYISFSAGGYTYDFKSATGQLSAGSYNDATRYPFNPAGTVGLSVYGNGRGCNTLTGRFIVHELEFGTGNTINKAAIDYEQHCEGSAPAMFGFIRVNSTMGVPDTDGDGVVDIQDNCPAISNADQLDGDGDRLGNACDPIQGPVFVSIDSQAGDYIGQGRFSSFPAVTASVSTDRTYISFSAGGYTYEFKSASGVLAVATYEGATRYPFNAAGIPGLSVSGNGRGCNTLTGRYVIHELQFGSGTKIDRAAIDFEQHCEGGTAALYGYIRLNSPIAIPNDSDADGFSTSHDNCPDMANSTQADLDVDGMGDVCDIDDDNDAMPDAVDNCPVVANADQFDADGDLQGDLCDSDDDNDGVPDTADALPLNAFESVDTDRDGIGNNADRDDDGDGVPDASDAFPLYAEAALDTDLDGKPDTLGVAGPEGFEINGFAGRSWQMGGNAAWVIADGVQNSGVHSARSGVITHSQTSSIQITQNMGASVSFLFKTSTENYADYLRFYVNGILVSSWSGTQGWQQYTRALTPGVNTLKWEYSKNGSVSTGLDAVWIDDITLGSPLTEDLDDDGDGALDVADNCVLVANAGQLDRDGDGIGDVCDAAPDFADSDSDGIANAVDNCPLTSNYDQINTDGDAQGNDCDSDDDNDGVPDASDLMPVDAALAGDNDGDGYDTLVDNCPESSNGDQLDTDHDGRGNACDADDDNDGVPDTTDRFPLQFSVSSDVDFDGFPDAWNAGCSVTCQADSGLVLDNCPASANASQLDSDGDLQGNACDTDDDNDGVPDVSDMFPLDASESVDNDGDGVGNNADSDDDNDLVADLVDNCALIANPDQLNTDADTQGNVCDSDDDGDGVADSSDRFPTSFAVSSDVDLDGYPGAWNPGCDVVCQSLSGLLLDNCPFSANANQLDFDTDAKGDVCDNDDDNDGVPDVADALPKDASETLDSDFDGIGNNADADDDNDLWLDFSDNCPVNSNTNQLDTDVDGFGNACDADDDNDGVADAADKFPLAAAASMDVDADGFADAWNAACGAACQAASGLTLDNCPTINNVNQLDTDADFLGDVCDSDDDGDGVLDAADNCPLVGNADQLDSDDDALGNICDAKPYEAIVVSWPTYQGNARHDGYVPVSVNAVGASLKWQKLVGNGNALNPVTTASGKVFVSVYGYFDSPGLYVLNASTGETLWNKVYKDSTGGTVHSVDPPAFADGRVYVQTGKSTGDAVASLWAYDANTGSQIFKSAFSAQWERYYAPTIVDGVVYVNGGQYGGMSAFDGLTGVQKWFAGLPQFDQWTPTVDDQYAYGYFGTSSSCMPDGLYVSNKVTGALIFKIQDPDYSCTAWSMNMAPVLGGKNDVFIINNGRLIRFDLQGRSIGWQVGGGYSGQPVVAKGVVYAIKGGQLVARDQLTGNLLWTVASLTGLQSPFVITNTHAFVASSSATFAIDLQSHQSVWSYAKSGLLALGDNVLYIASSDGKLTSIDMPQDTDRDGVRDQSDNCLFVANLDQLNTDGDAQGDLCDSDDDNDGVVDTLDAFPLNAAESVDTDADSVGNGKDADDDGDAVPDVIDTFPLDPSEWYDTDNDSIGNNADTDDDGDGIPDAFDAAPLDANPALPLNGGYKGANITESVAPYKFK